MRLSFIVTVVVTLYGKCVSFINIFSLLLILADSHIVIL
jgi:hypothetical protein